MIGLIWGEWRSLPTAKHPPIGVKTWWVRLGEAPGHGSQFAVRNVAARWHSGGNLILQGCELPLDGNHNGQGDSNPPVITRPASDPVNRESITVGNRIREQIEFLAIKPDGPLPRIF